MSELHGQSKQKEPEPKPCEVGDELYVHHQGQPCTGKVVCHGKHGATVAIDGRHHKLPWDKVLGHKRRVALTGDVVDQGEDGMIVQDKGGRRRFIAVPNEATEDPMVAKSLSAQRPVLLMKAAPGPGLAQKQITDKNGVQTMRWVSTAVKPQPAAHGMHVGFVNGEHKGHGRVIAAGAHGVQVKDNAAGVHRVRHEQVSHHWEGDAPPDHSPHEAPKPNKPEYHPRLAGEDDKAFAKRVVDKGESPQHLPEEHDKYFNTGGSTHVPLDRLHSTKSDEENQQGGDNGPKRMLAAYHGVLGKRDPIKVMPHKEKAGHYEVVDGNGTLTSAQKLGWKGLPTHVVSRDEGKSIRATDKAGDFFQKKDVAHLPEKAAQPHKSWEDLAKHGPAALDEFKGIMGKIGEAMGLATDKRTDAMTDEDWASPGGHLFLAPLKGEKRAAEKVAADYDGDWSKLSDMVRGTIAVSTMEDAAKAIAHIKASGLEIAQQPKNRMAKPTKCGYRDLMLIVKLPSGMLAELQVNLKSMQQAKSGPGHAQYEVNRSLEAKYGEPEPTDKWADEDHTAYYQAVEAQKKIYGDAWKAALSGDDDTPAAAEADGKPMIKSDTSGTVLVWKPKK